MGSFVRSSTCARGGVTRNGTDHSQPGVDGIFLPFFPCRMICSTRAGKWVNDVGRLGMGMRRYGGVVVGLCAPFGLWLRLRLDRKGRKRRFVR